MFFFSFYAAAMFMDLGNAISTNYTRTIIIILIINQYIIQEKVISIYDKYVNKPFN